MPRVIAVTTDHPAITEIFRAYASGDEREPLSIAAHQLASTFNLELNDLEWLMRELENAHGVTEASSKGRLGPHEFLVVAGTHDDGIIPCLQSLSETRAQEIQSPVEAARIIDVDEPDITRR